MLYQYWTVQTRPTPTSVTTIGVGVIVEDPATGQLAYRFADKLHTLLSRFPNSEVAVHMIHDLERWLKSVSRSSNSLELDVRFVPSGLLDTMAERWNNLISVSHRQRVPADSINAAVELLFDKLISPAKSPQKIRRIDQVRAQVLHVYESKEPLRKLIVSKPQLIIDDNLGEKADLGIIRGQEIFELNSAFSMVSQDLRRIEDRIQAWTWKMSTLRSSGAILNLTSGDSFEIDSNVPVVATLWPPQEKEQQNLLESMSGRWDKLGIDYICKDDIEAHAEKLSKLAA